MTGADERRARARQRGRDYINSEAGAVTAEALGALLEALERERGANNDEGRTDAQARYLEAKAVLDYEIEAPHVRRRRMAVEALDYPSGALVDAGDFRRVLTDCFRTLKTQAGRDKLRRLLSRYILDDEETIGRPAARLLVEKLSANSEGLLGAIDNVEGKSGVGKTTGKNVNIRTKVVMAAGYSAGVEFGLNGNIPSVFWKRAQRMHGRLVKEARAPGGAGGSDVISDVFGAGFRFISRRAEATLGRRHAQEIAGAIYLGHLCVLKRSPLRRLKTSRP